MTTYSERDVVLRERQAFTDGAVCWVGECRGRTHSYPPKPAVSLEEIVADAARKFPLPKITRPRIVEDSGHIKWRIQDCYLQWSNGDGDWRRTQEYNRMAIGAERVNLWADLFMNPNETVEDDS